MITPIFEHSLDVTLLPEKAKVLDAGCRGFGFTNAIRQLRPHARVLCIDIGEFEGDYDRVALAGTNGRRGVYRHTDPQATHTISGNELEAVTVETYSKRKKVKRWDLIKLDIEGDEMDVLFHAKHPMATQVSVEFHGHCGISKTAIDNLLAYLSAWYTIHGDVWEERYCAGHNYWDVLLIAKT